MLRAVACLCTAIGIATWGPVAGGSPAPIGEPVLPQSSKPVIAYSRWNELIHKALDDDAPSATKIGEMYAYGVNAPRDVGEAMRWLTRAADLGSTEARRELGLLLLRGEDTQRDSDHAAALLRQAADADDPQAEAALGVLSAFG